MEPEAATGSDRKRGSGVKLAYDVLRDEILDLVLQPGSAIDEVQLAERFNMSRTPIREALVRLAAEGLIHTLPNRSTLVAPIEFLLSQRRRLSPTDIALNDRAPPAHRPTTSD